ncbi:MFS transporter [Pseudonocardia zijingensis]|uniref:MFS transporter n=1 Tax=Pseudonocardia zijingensis TaxID=153376 RepID=UPI0031DFA908
MIVGRGVWKLIVGTLRIFGALPVAVRLLLVNQLAGNTAFYMLIPFLADYLLDDIGLSAVTVGVVLGVRNFSQQGLYLVGGSTADRLGTRGVIVVGLAVRAVGFALFAAGGSLAVVLLAAVCTGFAGALFNPAVRAHIAHDSGTHRAEAFALFNVFGNVGSTLGPLLGIAMVALGFRITAVAAAGIFAVLAIGQLLVLPSRPVERATTSVLGDLGELVANRAFWAFAVALVGMFALQSQIYFVLTLQAQQAAGPAGAAPAVAALFIAETVVSILFQVRVTRLCGAVARGRAMALGLSVMGSAFLVPPLGVLLVPPVPAAQLATVVVAATVLAFGVMIAQPFVNELIPAFGPARLTGTYFGAFYLLAGLTTVTLTPLLGAVVDAGGDALAWGPGLLCAAVALGSAAAILRLHRRGAVPTPVVAG